MGTELCLSYSDEAADALAVVFNGVGPMSGPRAVVDVAFSDMVAELQWLIDVRQHLAMSGAMRWPWSQEAPIGRSVVWRVG